MKHEQSISYQVACVSISTMNPWRFSRSPTQFKTSQLLPKSTLTTHSKRSNGTMHEFTEYKSCIY